jgi:F-type H+-transporting ATPase subunit a
MEAIEHPPIFHLPGIPDHVTYTWVVMIILAGIAFAASRRLELVPRGAQNLMEIVLEQIQGMIDDVMGPQGRPYLPFIATLGLFIFAANLLSLVPGTTGPTTNLNTTAACAVIVFFAYHAIGLRAQGPVNYIKHFMGPVWWLAPLMLPIELISHLARPVSLSLRLMGNMVADHKVVFTFFTLFPLLLPVPFLFLGLLVCFVQTFVFCVLTMIYIALATAHDH